MERLRTMRTIVWDVDDVLNSLMAAWFHQCWLPEHTDCRVTYAAIRANPPHAVLGIEESEYLRSLDGFRASDSGRGLAPNPEILGWMREHGYRFRHMALTARPLASAGTAAEWVFRHFGVYIRCYGVVPARLDAAAPAYDRDKADFLRWFQEADYFLDDSAANVAAVSELGVKALLFPQPWNGSSLSVEDTLKLLVAL
ncbi:MAG: hypothetical protein ABSC05_00925 [Candidatus Solibacter sp.]|jgi:hypothetical protein